MTTFRTPRLTVSRHGFLARSTALSWPWNQDRLLAAPGTMPPTFADLALGLVDRTKPVIRMWCKDPMQREDDTRETGEQVQQFLPLPLRGWAAKRTKAGGRGATTPDHDQSTPPPIPLPQGEGESVPPLPPPTPQQDPIHRERTGPLRNGNPRGNPNLAPRCGARTRRTGCPCRAPAMRNGRCRLHGGKSTGPRTAEGRAFQRNISGLLRSNRQLLALARQPGPVDAAALRHLLPPDLAKNLMQREDDRASPKNSPSPCGRGTGGGGAGSRFGGVSTPPPAPPARGGEKNASISHQHPVQRETPAQAHVHARQHTQLSDRPPSSSQAVTRGPILLARPTLLAT